jgi:hypothetical protein
MKNKSMKGKSKARKGRRGPGGSAANPPPTAIVYRGPVRTVKDIGQDTVIVRILHLTGTLSSSVGGVISAVITNNPSGSPDWSNLTPLWEEYRVLATELRWFPNYVNFNGLLTAFAQGPLAVASTRNPLLGLPSGITSVLSYGDSILTNSQMPWSLTVKMDNVNEAGFTNTANVGSTWAYPVYASGLTGGTQYGTYDMILRIQFRSQF